jgi:hypothetical protein
VANVERGRVWWFGIIPPLSGWHNSFANAAVC